ncbi:MAG TPA: TonB family protein [Terriglobales bacterium]|nr:TonB family protein [Terriglobales bacterium]
MASVRGTEAPGVLSQHQNQQERRCCARASILEGMQEMVVVRLGSHTGLLLDLSPRGFAVQALFPTPPQSSLNVEFRLPFTGDSIESDGEVVWMDNACRAGLKFVHLDDAPKSRLEAWLAAHHERATLPPALSDGQVEAETELSALEREISEGRSQPLSEILRRVAQRACLLMGADGAAILLREEEGVFCRASTGDAPDVGSRLKPDSGLTAECLRTGQVVLAEDVDKDPRVRPSTAKRLNLRSILIVPIQAQASVLGAVEVLSSRPSFFDATHAASLRRIAAALGPLLTATAQPREERPEVGLAQAPSAPVITTPATSRETLTEATLKRLRTVAQLVQGLQVRIRAAATRLRKGPRMVPHALAACVLLLAIAAMLTLAKFPSHDTSKPSSTPPRQASFQQNKKTAAQQSERGEKGTVQVAGKKRTSTPETDEEAAEVSGPRPVVATNPIGNSPRVIRSTARRPSAERVLPPPLATGGTADLKNLTAHFLDTPTAVPRLSPPERRLRVSEGVIRGRAVSRPLPAYPEPALKSGVQGSVILQGVISVDGTVKKLRVVQGDPLLAQSALDAAKKWRYDISYLNREPIEIGTIDEMKFSIGDEPEVSAPLRVSEGVTIGRAISQPVPSYPELARRLGVEGAVIVRGAIAVDGTVKSLHVVEGHALLTQAVLDAVRKWRFQPSYLNRVPVEVETVFVVHYRQRR